MSDFGIAKLTTTQGSSNVVMGGHEDPEDGNAVAGAVFGAVFIYIVCSMSHKARNAAFC